MKIEYRTASGRRFAIEAEFLGYASVGLIRRHCAVLTIGQRPAFVPADRVLTQLPDKVFTDELLTPMGGAPKLLAW